MCRQFYLLFPYSQFDSNFSSKTFKKPAQLLKSEKSSTSYNLNGLGQNIGHNEIPVRKQ